jgi:hypothetical protein
VYHYIKKKKGIDPPKYMTSLDYIHTCVRDKGDRQQLKELIYWEWCGQGRHTPGPSHLPNELLLTSLR